MGPPNSGSLGSTRPMPNMGDAQARAGLVQGFPRLKGTQFEVTSPETRDYNCIAWAAGDNSRWWWPGVPPLSGYYWPNSLGPIPSLDDFRLTYEMEGFSSCADGSLEPGFEKIAIYAKNGVPQHAARQLIDGTWTSKCGESHDISHDAPGDVGGLVYGEVALYMRRPSQAP